MKKQILFLNGHLNTGGVEKSLVDILRHFDYSKYDVDLVLLESLGDYVINLPEQVNVRFVDLRNTYGSFLKSIIHCVRQHDWICLKMRVLFLMCKLLDVRQLRHAGRILFDDKTYDAVIGFRPGICTNIAAFAVNADKKLTWWHHGEYDLNQNAEKDYHLACKEMTSVISVSESCVAFLRKNLPDISAKLKIIPNLISVTDVSVKADEIVPYKKKDDTKHIVSVGRLASEKHMENNVFAAQKLVEHGITNFKWYIVGDGFERNKLETLTQENGMSEYFVFTGSKANPYPYMKHADLFVHPSYVESQGLVVLEAMALGIPCVVTKSLGPCEFIKDGVNGLLTEQSPEALAEKVVEILSNQELYDKVKANTYCPERFSPCKVIKEVEHLLED